ncbi:MAG: hypothetical protein WAO83_18025 [Fuerstiella sp.]
MTLDDVFPEGIVTLKFAAEARTLLVGTKSGHLLTLREDGTQVCRERGFDGLRMLAWCETGKFGAAALQGGELVCFDEQLKTLWKVKFTGEVVGLGISPFGSHIAASTESSRVHIVTTDKREIAKFETTRPLEFIQFLQDSPKLIGAAEFGHLCCHTLDGREEWNERIANNVGNMVVSGCGKRILLAAFNHGIQVLNENGKQKGAFMIDGIPNLVSASSSRKRIAATTLEHRLYWLKYEGELVWACDLSADPVISMAVGPLGNRLFIATTSGRLLQLVW